MPTHNKFPPLVHLCVRVSVAWSDVCMCVCVCVCAVFMQLRDIINQNGVAAYFNGVSTDTHIHTHTYIRTYTRWAYLPVAG